MSFPEELYRKCIAHMRPHPSDKATEVNLDVVPEEEEKEDINGTDEKPVRVGDEEDEDRRDVEDGARHEGKGVQKEKKVGNGGGGGASGGVYAVKSSNEKWEEVVDNKLRPLLENVDVTEYGGRDPEK